MLRTCLDLRQKNHTFRNDVVLICDSSADKLTTGANNNPSLAVRITLIIKVHVMTPAHSAPYPYERVHSRLYFENTLMY